MPEMSPHDADVTRLAGQTYTLAEFLRSHAPASWDPPRLARRALVQTHCHQHAIMGFEVDTALMRRAGIDAAVPDSGCCGLDGNFGFEAGHHEVSMACAERVLLPAIRNATPETLVLADGFSCRTQIEQGESGRTALHLAEALYMGLAGDTGGPYPERAAQRPAIETRASRGVSVAAAVGAAGALAVGLAVLRRRRRRS